MKSQGALAGVRVLDFGRYIAGPYCAAMLADLGADVIRVERPIGAEDRALMPLDEDARDGALYVQMNQNKRGITLNPRHPAGRGVLHRLVASAEVVIANLPDPALERLGLDYASLAAVRPDIVLTTVTAFGEGGPWANRPGFDGIGQAMAGAAYLSGDGERPTKSYVLWVDILTAAFSAFATVAALTERTRTGRGQHVRASLLGSALAAASTALIEEAELGVGRTASGNRAQVAGPADIYATADGWVIVQVVGDAMFRGWVDVVERPELGEDERFASDQTRGDHRDLLAEVMSPWCAVRGTDEVLETLAGAGIPAAPVLSPAAALLHPQVQAGGWLVRIDGADEGAPPIVRLPLTMPHGTQSARSRAPQLGEHTDEVLASLGYDRSMVGTLRSQGAI